MNADEHRFSVYGRRDGWAARRRRAADRAAFVTSNRRRLAVFALVALVGVAGCERSGEIPSLVRLSPPRGVWFSVAIDDVSRPVLDPTASAHELAIPAALPPEPELRVFVGRRAAAPQTSVRFAAVLRTAAGKETTLVEHDLDGQGWHELRAAMPAAAAQGRLYLRKTTSGEAGGALSEAVWSEPVIVSGQPTDRPSIVLFSIDTLRADALGFAGAATDTPAFDRLAGSGVRYTAAYSPSTWTLPSHLPLLYGEPPIRVVGDCDIKSCSFIVPKGVRPLPEILRSNAYLTAGFTGGGWMSPNFRVSRGFDVFYAFRGTPQPAGECRPERLDGPDVFRRAEQWLADFGHLPFFLFVHTYDVHDECEVKPRHMRATIPWVYATDEAKRKAPIHYERQVRHTDRLLAGFLDRLHDLGLADKTMVVLTSDHGQAFWEHGFHGHGCSKKPYDELARVPLLVSGPFPDATAKAVDLPVPLTSIAPTLLAALGIEVPDQMRDGILPGLGVEGEPPSAAITHCSEVLGIRAGRYKMITSRDGSFADEVYDMLDDPGEQKNLAEQRVDLRESLAARATQYWRSAASAEQPGEPAPDPADGATEGSVDPSTEERLRALGY